MRLGLVLELVDGERPLRGLVAQARHAEQLGFAIGWLEEVDPAGPPLITAAALADGTATIKLAACVAGEDHPLELAAAATVADNATGGRLTLALRAGSAGVEGAEEVADLLLAAFASRPFRHRGERWQAPANLPANEIVEERILLTPPTAQLELPLWLVGESLAAVARERGLAWVASEQDARDRATAEWTTTEDELGVAAARLRRPALRTVVTGPDGTLDADALVAGLRQEQGEWGMDVAILRLEGPDDLDARLRALDQIASWVLPRIQLDRMPAGLEDHWRERLPDQIEAARRS